MLYRIYIDSWLRDIILDYVLLLYVGYVFIVYDELIMWLMIKLLMSWIR